MTTSSDPDEIRAEIAQTRAALSDDVDRLGESASPRNVARRQVDRAKDAAGSLKDKVFGSDDDGPGLSDRLESGRDAIASAPSAAKDALASVPSTAKAKARGNPLAAGLIAFGAGLLISGLIPSSEKEQQAVGRLEEKVEPLKQQATQAVQQTADNLRQPAQEAVESVKSTATEATQTVREEGSAAAGDVKQQVAESKDNVQNT